MSKNKSGEATFGGGCFWCTEAVFRQLKGVKRVEPGYAGGEVLNPTYNEVCAGTTGHAEVVRIEFDPLQLNYDELLEVFFKTHDPTQINRQGNDVGTQYRSVIFYHDEGQKKAAENFIRGLTSSAVFEKPVVTEVSPLTNYFTAENYHHDYFANNPSQPYCAMVINPKLQKFKKEFGGKLNN